MILFDTMECALLKQRMARLRGIISYDSERASHDKTHTNKRGLQTHIIKGLVRVAYY